MTTLIPDGFDSAALRWAGTRQRDRRAQAMAALARADLGNEPAMGFAALSDLFGLTRAHHFLRADRSAYRGLAERKMTEAMASAIGVGEDALAATQALFNAVLGQERIELRRALSPIAEAEVAVGKAKGRIDLLLRAVRVDGAPLCLAIEAKFGHVLGRHQLAMYRPGALRYLRDMAGGGEVPERNAILVVVAPSLTADIETALAADRQAGRMPPWRFVSWRRLLLDTQAALPDTAAAARFRLLLRHLWDRCDDC